MNGLSSIGRLAMRPFVLGGGAFGLVTAVVIPILASGPGIDPAALDASQVEYRHVLLWRETVTLPWFVGMMTGIMIGELRGSFIGWTLPGMRRAHATGCAVLCLVVSAIVGAVHGLTGANFVAPFGVAALAFSFGLIANAGVLRWPSLLFWPIVAVLLKPAPLLLLVDYYPLVTGIAFAALAVPLIRSLLSSTRHRRRAEEMMELGGVLLSKMGNAGRRVMSRASGRIHRTPADMVRAAERIMYPDFLGWTRAQLWGAGFAGTMAYVMNNGFIIVTIMVIAAIAPSVTAVDNVTSLPMSRRQRADARVIATLRNMLQYALFTTMVALLLFALRPFPQFLADGDLTVNPLRIGTAVWGQLLWFPVLQWAASYPPIMYSDPVAAVRGQFNLRMGLAFVAFLVLAGGTMSMTRSIAEGIAIYPLIAVGIASIVTTNVGAWLLLRRAYAREDLI